jgi:hypothetical protein
MRRALDSPDHFVLPAPNQIVTLGYLNFCSLVNFCQSWFRLDKHKKTRFGKLIFSSNFDLFLYGQFHIVFKVFQNTLCPHAVMEANINNRWNGTSSGFMCLWGIVIYYAYFAKNASKRNDILNCEKKVIIRFKIF